jgi:hypothetical protein
MNFAVREVTEYYPEIAAEAYRAKPAAQVVKQRWSGPTSWIHWERRTDMLTLLQNRFCRLLRVNPCDCLPLVLSESCKGLQVGVIGKGLQVDVTDRGLQVGVAGTGLQVGVTGIVLQVGVVVQGLEKGVMGKGL